MKKKIVYATMLMSTIALLSTGFAAWIISGNDEDTKDGYIAVDTVSNVSRMIESFVWNESNLDDGNAVIKYSIPENPKTIQHNDRITNDAEFGYENLEVSATFTITNIDSEDTAKNKIADILSVDFILTNKKNDEGNAEITNYEKAIEDGYITPMPVWDSSKPSQYKIEETGEHSGEYGIKVTLSSHDSDSKKATYLVSIKFNWGKIFNYQNPYYFYGNANSFVASEAETTLNQMRTYLNEVMFTLKITTKSAVSVNSGN